MAVDSLLEAVAGGLDLERGPVSSPGLASATDAGGCGSAAGGFDLGSLLEFIESAGLRENLVAAAATAELAEESDVVDVAEEANRISPSSSPRVLPLSARVPTPPDTNRGGPRRQVERVGNKLSRVRAASARNQQMRSLLPRLPADRGRGGSGQALPRLRGSAGRRSFSFSLVASASLDAAGASLSLTPSVAFAAGSQGNTSRGLSGPLGMPLSPTGGGSIGSSTGPAGPLGAGGLAGTSQSSTGPVPAPPKQAPKPRSNFEPSFMARAATLKAERHHLLAALEGMHDDDVLLREPEVEQGALAYRLEELRSTEPRRGHCTAPPPPGGEEAALLRSAKPALHAAASARPPPPVLAGVERLVRLLDTTRSGTLAPDVFVALMFWLGLTRRRSAALMLLETAFGKGSIDVGEVRRLTKYADVQGRLVEGFRGLAKQQAPEQLFCEFITDWARLREWFYTMRRDTAGRVDIVEVQNLFSRMELTADRQALFRFLSDIAERLGEPSLTEPKGGDGSGAAAKPAVISRRTFGIAGFAALICRCTVTWVVHKTLAMISPEPQHESGSASPTKRPRSPRSGLDVDREVALRWTQLQRKIIVSLLVNHQFWGRESRVVLASLAQPAVTTFGKQLQPAQWLSLYQRVRAQGLQATLPTLDEADDNDFLTKMVSGAIHP